MVDIDPGKIRNWGLIAASIVGGVIAVATFALDSVANDKRHDTEIVQVSADVREIAKLFREDMDGRAKERAAQRSSAKLMQKLCKQASFKAANEGDCAFYAQLLTVIGED